MSNAPYIVESIPVRIVAAPEVSSLYPGNCAYTKDFCIVPPTPGKNDGWVGYGSGGTSETEEWLNLRITSDNPFGPFVLQKPLVLLDKNGNNFVGPQLCAPSVLYDQKAEQYVMTIQEACFEIKRDIHLFTSKDGEIFHHKGSIFSSEMSLPHQGAYDPEHAEIKNRDKFGNVIGSCKVCVYSGINRVSLGKVYLAESTTDSWEGPWRFVSRIFGSKEATSHHNHDNDPDREWCCEGEQLFELDEETVSPKIFNQYGRKPIVILNYVGFYPKSYQGNLIENGTRQHNAFAAILHEDFENLFSSKNIREKVLFTDLGPLHKYSSFKETGHGTLRQVSLRTLGLYRQEREFNPVTKKSGPWQYALDIIDADELYTFAMDKIQKEKLKKTYGNAEFVIEESEAQ